jgi:hypothetical protein
MRKLLLSGILFLTYNFVTAQPIAVSWNLLQDIEFADKYFEEIKGYMLFPKFTSELKNLNGKEVFVEGYVIPFDKTGATVALSANPYASCFFCGKAGAASVMTLKFKVPNTKYKTDQYKYFKGKLKLNDSDIKQFYYVLEFAEEISK